EEAVMAGETLYTVARRYIEIIERIENTRDKTALADLEADRVIWHMNLQAIARAYVSCVELEEKAGGAAPELLEDLAPLRAYLHAVLMDALRQSKIFFADRQDA